MTTTEIPGVEAARSGRPLPAKRRPPTSAARGAAAPPRRTRVVTGEPGNRRFFLAFATNATVVVAIGMGVLFALGLSSERLLVLGITAVCGIALGLVAALRFWLFLLLLYALRPALDYYSKTSSSLLEPGTAAGGVFLLASVLWLLAQKRAGRLYPVSRTAIALCVLAVASALSAVVSLQPIVSLNSTLRVVAAALMALVLEQVFHQNPERIKGLLIATACSLVLPALASLREFLIGPSQGFYVEVGRIQGTFTHPNPFATYLFIVAILALAVRPHVRRGARLACTPTLAVSSALLLFTYTRALWAAMIVGTLVIGVMQARRIIWVVLITVLVVFMAVPSVSTRLSDLQSDAATGQDTNSFSWRVGYWERIIPLADSSPVNGIGLGATNSQTFERLEPHNIWVQAYVETGLTGLLALGFFVTMCARDLLRARRNTAPGLQRGITIGVIAVATGLLLISISENLLTQAVMWFYFVGPMAWVIATTRTPQPGSIAATRAARAERRARRTAGSAGAPRRSSATLPVETARG